MENLDLTTYTLDQLLDLQASLPREIEKRRSGAIADARREMKAIADRLGLSVADLMAQPISGTKGVLPPQYKHPRDPSLTWSGYGRKPSWIKSLELENYTLDQLRINV